MTGHSFLKQRYEHLYHQAQELERELRELRAVLAKCRERQTALEDRIVLLTVRLFDLVQEVEKEVEGL